MIFKVLSNLSHSNILWHFETSFFPSAVKAPAGSSSKGNRGDADGIDAGNCAAEWTLTCLCFWGSSFQTSCEFHDERALYPIKIMYLELHPSVCIPSCWHRHQLLTRWCKISLNLWFCLISEPVTGITRCNTNWKSTVS